MRHNFLWASLVLFCLIMSVSQVRAQDYFHQSYNDGSNRQPLEFGLALKLPFGGGLNDRALSSYEVVASFGVRPRSNQLLIGQPSSFSPRLNVADIRFDGQGMKRLSLSGRAILMRENGALILGSNHSEDDKSSWGTAGLVLGGVVLVGAGIYALCSGTDLAHWKC